MKDLINYDLIKNGIPDESKYKEVEKKIIGLYLKRDKLLTETITTTTTKTTIKIKLKLRSTILHRTISRQVKRQTELQINLV